MIINLLSLSRHVIYLDNLYLNKTANNYMFWTFSFYFHIFFINLLLWNNKTNSSVLFYFNSYNKLFCIIIYGYLNIRDCTFLQLLIINVCVLVTSQLIPTRDNNRKVFHSPIIQPYLPNTYYEVLITLIHGSK